MNKWTIAIKVLPILLVIAIIKSVFHYYGCELLGLNPFFTSVVAATIFLIGFLTSGVMSDYKESEKMPSEIAASLEAIYDEAYAVKKGGKFASPECRKAVEDFMAFYHEFLSSLLGWFERRERTQSLMEKISVLTDHFVALEGFSQPAFIARIKADQSAIRRNIGRIHTIRETDFVVAAYAIVEILAALLIVGMLLIRIEPFYEAVFFTVLVAFVVVYMIFLIKDMDNPFDYADGKEQGSEVSLKPIRDFQKRFAQKEGKTVL